MSGIGGKINKPGNPILESQEEAKTICWFCFNNFHCLQLLQMTDRVQSRAKTLPRLCANLSLLAVLHGQEGIQRNDVKIRCFEAGN